MNAPKRKGKGGGVGKEGVGDVRIHVRTGIKCHIETKRMLL